MRRAPLRRRPRYYGVAMARRKKRRKGASKQPSSSVTRREFQAGPLLVAQTGSEVSFRVDREHPEYAEFKEAVAEEVESTPARVVEVRERIAELCAPYHAFDVVFAVWMTFGLVRPGTLKPLDTEGSTATPEYVAHVLLDRLTPEPVREPTGETVRRTVNPHELGGLVREILQRLPPWFGYRQSGGKHESDPWLELRTRLYTHRDPIVRLRMGREEDSQDTLRTVRTRAPSCSGLLRRRGDSTRGGPCPADAGGVPALGQSRRASSHGASGHPWQQPGRAGLLRTTLRWPTRSASWPSSRTPSLIVGSTASRWLGWVSVLGAMQLSPRVSLLLKPGLRRQ